jgi:hypothetical protein
LHYCRVEALPRGQEARNDTIKEKDAGQNYPEGNNSGTQAHRKLARDSREEAEGEEAEGEEAAPEEACRQEARPQAQAARDEARNHARDPSTAGAGARQ